MQPKRMFILAIMALLVFGWTFSAAAAEGQGRLFLVSTGNGDPENITIRALNVIKDSDIVFCNKRKQKKFPLLLQGKEIHDPGFGIFAVYGKSKKEFKLSDRFDYDKKMRQMKNISRIVRHGVKEGQTVSVLCSGDPTIYGPNMWYMEAFADLDPEIVTGVSCFNAANAALEKGITSGDKAHSVILTATFGREDYDGADSVEKLAEHQATMAFFTMFMDVEKVVDQLKTHYPGDTPAAIVRHAGYKDKERVISGTLDTICGKVDQKDFAFEYMFYVGDFMDKK